jgi:hypothetical protein
MFFLNHILNIKIRKLLVLPIVEVVDLIMSILFPCEIGIFGSICFDVLENHGCLILFGAMQNAR